MLSANPVFAISCILILLVPNTIAFGGVPTGSMNAQLAAIAAGTISVSGWTSSAIARPASTGMIIVAVAVLDVISVRNRIPRATMAMTMTIDRKSTRLNSSH